VQSLVRKWPLLTGQHCCHRARENRACVNPWNARLHRSNSLASQQSWPQTGRLPDLRKLQERVYCSRIHDVAQLKSRLIEEWKHFNQMITWSSMKQSGSDVHVIRLVFEHVENILKTYFKYVWLLHLTFTCLDVANIGQFMFSGELATLAVTSADFTETWRFVCD